MQNGSLERIGRPPSWIFKIKFLTAYGHERRVRYHHAKFVEIGRNVAEISRFLVFIVKIHLTTRA